MAAALLPGTGFVLAVVAAIEATAGPLVTGVAGTARGMTGVAGPVLLVDILS
jgi:hypothetical protein